MPTVSVVMPVYNHANFVREAIVSVLGQTLANLELILVDDGSDDHLHVVLSRIRDPRLRVVVRPHRGLPAALNTGFSLARGQYVTWTSADNVMLPRCLECLHRALVRRPRCGAAYADYKLIDRWGNPLRRASKGPFRLAKRMNFGPAFLLRRTVAERAGPFDEDLEGFEDRDHALRVAQLAPVYWLKEVLYLYRVHDESLSGRLHRSPAVKDAVRRRFREKWRHLPAPPKRRSP